MNDKNKLEALEEIQVIGTDEPKVEFYDGVSGRKWKREVIGWVAGITYTDGYEWLYDKNGLEKLYRTKHALTFTTKEKAIAHARKFKPWVGCPKFVRPYMLETLIFCPPELKTKVGRWK